MTELVEFGTTFDPEGPVELREFSLPNDYTFNIYSMPQRTLTRSSYLLAASNGSDPIFELQNVKSVPSIVDENSRANIEATKMDITTSAIVSPTLEQKEMVEKLQAEIEGSEYLNRWVSPAVVQLLISPNAASRSYAVSRLADVQAMYNAIESRLGEEKDLWNFGDRLEFYGDLLDAALVSGVGEAFYIDEQNEAIRKIENIMFSSLKPDAKEEAIGEVLDEMADQGWLTQDNEIYLKSFLIKLGYGELSTEAASVDWWSKFNTITMLAPGIGYGGLAARPTRGLLRLTDSNLGSASSAASLRAGATTESRAVGALNEAENTLRDTASAVGSKTGDPERVKNILSETILADDISEATTDVIAHTSPTSLRITAYTDPPTWTGTSHEAFRMFEMENEAWQEVKRIFATSGESVDTANRQAIVDDIVQQRSAAMEASEAKRYQDTVVWIDEAENFVYGDVLGKADGGVFVSPDSAGIKALAERTGGRIAIKDDGYVVVVEGNYAIEPGASGYRSVKAWDAANPDEFGGQSNWLGRLFSSSLLRFSATDNALLKMGEAASEQYTAWLERTKRQLERAAGGEAKSQEVYRAFDYMRDSKDWADVRRSMTVNEFRAWFARTYNGRVPSEGQVALYLKTNDILTADLMLKADVYYKDAVSKGVRVWEDAEGNAWRVVPVRAGDIPDPENVYFRPATSADNQPISDLDPDAIIYRAYGHEGGFFDNSVMYVELNKTRRITHGDFYYQNSGGPRTIANRFDAAWFVKQDRSSLTVGGVNVPRGPVTAIAARTEKEVAQALTEMNNIVMGIRTALGRNSFTNADVLTLIDDADLNNLIRANNRWAPDNDSVEALVKWADDNAIDLDTDFVKVRSGDNIIDTSMDGVGGMHYDDMMMYRAMTPRARGKEAPKAYGGITNPMLLSEESIFKSIASTMAKTTERAFISRTGHSLIKAALNAGVLENAGEIAGKTLRNKIREMKINTSSKVGRQLAGGQRSLLARMDRRGWADAWWQDTMYDFASFLYDKNMRGKPFEVAKWAMDHNPLTALRGLAFHAKLGLFAIEQFMIQSSQIINVGLVSGVSGAKGIAALMPVRWALFNGSPEVIADIARRTAKIVGLTEDQFVEMVTMLQQSGRTKVGVALAELGPEAAEAVSIRGKAGRGVQKVAKAGRFAFNEGELWARVSAHNSAYIEWVTKNPGKSALSQEGRRFIAHRQDLLTQGMTSASKGSFEVLPMGQFLSYSFRINEALFAGTFNKANKTVLSRAEKARLGFGHLLMYGAAGYSPFYFLTNRVDYLYDTEIEQTLGEDAWKFVRLGLLDTVLSNAFGVETALSERIGGGEGLVRMMKDLVTESAFAQAVGPSGEVTGDILSAMTGMFYLYYHGEFQRGTKDGLLKLIRTVTTGNRIVDTYFAMRLSQKFARNGALVDNWVSKEEAIMNAFGIPLEEYSEIWSRIQQKKTDELLLRSGIKAMQSMLDKANAAYARGDFQEAFELQAQAGVFRSSFPLSDQAIMDREVFETKGSQLLRTTFDKAQQDMTNFLERMSD